MKIYKFCYNFGPNNFNYSFYFKALQLDLITLNLVLEKAIDKINDDINREKDSLDHYIANNDTVLINIVNNFISEHENKIQFLKSNWNKLIPTNYHYADGYTSFYISEIEYECL